MECLLCIIQMVSLLRSDSSFDSFETFLIGYRNRPNKVQVPLWQGLQGLLVTVRVSPNNRLRLRKRPFAYTQKLLPDFERGTVGAGLGYCF